MDLEVLVRHDTNHNISDDLYDEIKLFCNIFCYNLLY